MNSGMQLDAQRLLERNALISSDNSILADRKCTSKPRDSRLASSTKMHGGNELYSLRSSAKEKLHHRGQVNIVDMSAEDIPEYKFFLVYEDLLSKFVVLKALANDTPKAVAAKLIDVFAIIGAPQVLQSDSGRQFTQALVKELRLLWDDLLVLDGEMSGQSDTADFKILLNRWLKKNPSKAWNEGLKFVQVLYNTTFPGVDDQVPCNVQFGRKVQERFERLTIDTDLKRSVCMNVGNSEKNIARQTKEESIKRNGHANLEVTTAKKSSNEPQYRADNSSEVREPQGNPHSFDFVNVKDELSPNMQTEDTTLVDESAIVPEARSEESESNLKCKICKKKYIKQGHLKNHMKTHVRGKKYECTLCSKKFHILTLYVKHLRQSHGQSKSSVLSRTQRNQTSVSNASSNDIQDEAETNEDSTVENKSNDSCKRKPSAENRAAKLNGDSPLECTYCKQKFNFPSVLKRHMRSHTNERPYICDVCNKSFKQLGHLSQHSLTHKDYRSFQCTLCGIKFESLESLKTHSLSHKGESIPKEKEMFRLFECDNCKKVFTTKSVLERHIFTHTHERQFGCKICGKRFKQAGHVKSHMLVHTGERKFECTVCSKRFSLSNSLKKHMYVHNGEKPYQCDVCGARFLEKRNLNGHLMTHTNERPFRCKVCGKRYTLADTLRRHISAAHEDGRTYQCEICAKMFKQLAHLSVHKKVHNDERPFQCHLCEKTFKHKNVLKSHLAIHANVRPFECDVCKATFVRKTNLQTHIASAHMNERPYACTICEKRFKQISHLNGHVVVHSNSMPYQCDYCDRRCNRLDNLKKHMRLHTKNKE